MEMQTVSFRVELQKSLLKESLNKARAELKQAFDAAVNQDMRKVADEVWEIKERIDRLMRRL
jgi:hypothetical protein